MTATIEAARLEPVIPSVALSRPPASGTLASRALVLAWVLLGIFALDRIALVFMDFWLLQSLGYESVFWTNFWTGAAVFVAVLVVFFGAILLAVLAHRVAGRTRRQLLSLGLLVGVFVAWRYYSHYGDYLGFFNSVSFNERDPVFGHDISFYVFNLAAIHTTVSAILWCLFAGMTTSALCAWITHPRDIERHGRGRLSWTIGMIATPVTVALLGAWGLFQAIRVWLSAFNLLLANNTASSIPVGAEYLDFAGIFSTKNDIYVTAVLGFLAGTTLTILLRRHHRLVRSGTAPARTPGSRPLKIIVFLLVLEVSDLLGFKSLVALKNMTQVEANEPVIQLPFIKRHINATLKAWGLKDVEEKQLVPKSGTDPLPDLATLLEHPSIKNAGLWPGYVSYLERQIDPEYLPRLFLTEDGSTQIYGTTLETFRAQQKLRPYYDFLDVDTVRYEVDGADQIMASAVRELPLIEPQPWLAWWGQRFVLFTHGHGLVMAPIGEVSQDGLPVYSSSGIPPVVSADELRTENPAVYYGEGSGSVAFSNLRRINEFDHPTEQGRAETRLPATVKAGVKMDSFLKRLVFGWKSRSFMNIVFSDLIRSDARVHYYRTPLERVERIAPFLYFDTDPYAVAGRGGMTWMVNGITTSDKYPYSMWGELGDKSDRRTPTPRVKRIVNYARDSVKATVDAYTGQVNFYGIAKDDPVLRSWSQVYPHLFKPESAMPGPVRGQRQFPPQLFHVMFDDLYIYYHQRDPLTFFNQEDPFDDADELVGPMLGDGRAITFSIEPYYWDVLAGTDLPASKDDPRQFAMSMVFTPEQALNLRAIATVYMDGEDYGKLSLLQVPKGRFFPGPEQAEAAIDQDAFISQQIGLWNRRGTEVIRGHMTTLVVDGEVIYIEPMFIRSKQNPVPQLKRVVVVLRGVPHMGTNIPDALKLAIEGGTPPALDEGTLGGASTTVAAPGNGSGNGPPASSSAGGGGGGGGNDSQEDGPPGGGPPAGARP